MLGLEIELAAMAAAVGQSWRDKRSSYRTASHLRNTPAIASVGRAA